MQINRHAAPDDDSAEAAKEHCLKWTEGVPPFPPRLRRPRFGLFWERLPSLELLDAFSRRSLVAGVVFLTLTIGFGHLVRRSLHVGESYWDAKVITTNVLWLVALLVVVARRLDKIRPATSAVAAVGLFVLTLANLLVVDLFSQVHRGL